MLVLNRSLLNREYILIHVQKALVSIISMCNLHVIFLSKIAPRYFMLFTNGMFRPSKDSVKIVFLALYGAGYLRDRLTFYSPPAPKHSITHVSTINNSRGSSARK
jgi:hypothetical protein